MLEFITSKYVAAIVNLILLYILMRKFLFVPVTQFMENRTKSIKDSIDEAENYKIESKNLQSKYSEKLLSAKSEAADIITKAQSKANKEYDNIIKAAKEEAEKIKANALLEIENEKQAMIAETKNYIAEISIKAAGKLISSNLDNEMNIQLVNNFINEEGVA